VFHVEPRRTCFVPYPDFGHEFHLSLDQLSGERMTVCKHFGPPPEERLKLSYFYDSMTTGDPWASTNPIWGGGLVAQF